MSIKNWNNYTNTRIDEKVKAALNNGRYEEALKLIKNNMNSPEVFRYPAERNLLRGIALWKLSIDKSYKAERDINKGLDWCDNTQDLSFFYCRWARGIKGRMRLDIHSDLKGALVWFRINQRKYPDYVWASAGIQEVLFKQKKFNEFIVESKKAERLLKKELENKSLFINARREEMEDRLKEIYFFQAQHYFKKGRKAYTQAYFAIDNAIRLDPNYQDAVNFRKKIYCADVTGLNKFYREITGC